MAEQQSATDKYVGQVRAFTLPPEFSNEPKKETPTPAPEAAPASPAAPPIEAKTPAVEAPATPPATEAKTPAEPGKETTGKDLEKPEVSPRRFERRIDRATKARAEALARAEAAERELAEIKARSTQAADPEEPKAENYTDLNEFGKAQREYGAKKAARDAEAKTKREAEESAQASLRAEWDERANRGASKYEDFDEIVGDLTPDTPMKIAIMKAENGDEVAYHLAKHMKEAQRIHGLDPYSQVFEIAKLAAKLAQPPAAPKEPSKAPAPIAPLSSPSAVASDTIRETMPFEEYKRIMDKRMGRTK